MVSEKIRDLKDRYQNGYDNIGRDFLGVCLEACKRYRRGTAFFSSSALMSWADAMDHLINDQVKIEIMCSPVISDRYLIETLANNANSNQRKKTLQSLSDQIVLAALGFQKNNDRNDFRGKLLSYLIASEQLEFRFAIPNNYDFPDEKSNERNLYHVKVGYFIIDDDHIVAFEGSVNESDSAHQYNYESTQVFKNWILEDSKRANALIKSVDTDWNGLNPHLEIYKLSAEALEKIKAHSPDRRPRKGELKIPVSKPTLPGTDPDFLFTQSLWTHQKSAIEIFLNKKSGVLEMATGTGKTVTAFEIIRQLYIGGQASSVIICTYGTNLLEQWSDNATKWVVKYSNSGLENIKIFKDYDDNHEAISFLNSPNNSLLIISRAADKLNDLLSSQAVDWSRTIIVHDEIHGFGSPALVKALRGTHYKIAYRLGLSATPERIYDQNGSQFIEDEVGKVIYTYPLESAIRDGILCEFTYTPIEFDLQQSDHDRYKKIYASKAGDARNGIHWSAEKLATELSKVTKLASIKPEKLNDYLTAHPDHIKSSIVFVLEKSQGDEICNVINKFTHRYRSYYQGTDSVYITQLANGAIDTLIACERLNEGIDIKQLGSVILISSDAGRLNTIQRIGRCLRKDPKNPNKVSRVIDFVLKNKNENGNNTDQLRKTWLQDVANTKKSR